MKYEDHNKTLSTIVHRLIKETGIHRYHYPLDQFPSWDGPPSQPCSQRIIIRYTRIYDDEPIIDDCSPIIMTDLYNPFILDIFHDFHHAIDGYD